MRMVVRGWKSLVFGVCESVGVGVSELNGEGEWPRNAEGLKM